MLLYNWTTEKIGNIVERRYCCQDEIIISISQFCTLTRITHSKSFYQDTPELIKTCAFTTPHLSISAHINRLGQISKIKAYSQQNWQKITVSLNHKNCTATIRDKRDAEIINLDAAMLYQQMLGFSVPLSDADIMYLRMFLL